MRSLSSVGLGLSMVFACLLVALLAELYYLLWWKKRFARPDVQNDYSNHPRNELLFILCCRNPNLPPSSSSSWASSSALNPKPRVQEPQPVQKNPNLLLQPFGNHNNGGAVEDHLEFGNLGPGLMPRFLFTIMEETKEDLESEDGMSVKGKSSLSDLFLNMESGATPYLTPLASPSLFSTPPLTPLMESCCGNRNKNKKEGLYTFFESSADAEFNRLVRSSPPSSSSLLSSPSPPPRFKFLRDAEDKLYSRRLMEMAEAERLRVNINDKSSFQDRINLRENQQENGSLVRVIVEKSNEKESNLKNEEGEVHFQSTISHVLHHQ